MDINIKSLFKKKSVSVKSKLPIPRSQNDVLFIGAVGTLALFVIIVAIDAYIFYTTVLTPEAEPTTEASLVFPKRELKTLTQLLDARQEKFTQALPAPEVPKKK